MKGNFTKKAFKYLGWGAMMIVLWAIFHQKSKAQHPSEVIKAFFSGENDCALHVVDQLPLFNGCDPKVGYSKAKTNSDKKMKEFIYSRLKYPIEALQNRIEGMVIVQICINPEGKTQDLKLMRDIGGGCGQEAMRTINQMPKWCPAKRKKENTNCILNIPVKFKIS